MNNLKQRLLGMNFQLILTQQFHNPASALPLLRAFFEKITNFHLQFRRFQRIRNTFVHSKDLDDAVSIAYSSDQPIYTSQTLVSFSPTSDPSDRQGKLDIFAPNGAISIRFQLPAIRHLVYGFATVI